MSTVTIRSGTPASASRRARLNLRDVAAEEVLEVDRRDQQVHPGGLGLRHDREERRDLLAHLRGQARLGGRRVIAAERGRCTRAAGAASPGQVPVEDRPDQDPFHPEGLVVAG